MDYLRACYETECRFFGDSNATAKIRWCFAADDAEVFPAVHRFGSGNWSSPNVASGLLGPLDWPGPGEVLGSPRTWVLGILPAGADGKHFCGTLDQFNGGATFDPAADFAYTPAGLLAACVSPLPPINPHIDQRGGQWFAVPFPFAIPGALLDKLVIFAVAWDPATGDPGNCYVNGATMFAVATVNSPFFGSFRVYVGDANSIGCSIDCDNPFVPSAVFWLTFAGVSAANLVQWASLYGTFDPAAGPDVSFPGLPTSTQLAVSLIFGQPGSPFPWYQPNEDGEMDISFGGGGSQVYMSWTTGPPATWHPELSPNAFAVPDFMSVNMVFA